MVIDQITNKLNTSRKMFPDNTFPSNCRSCEAPARLPLYSRTVKTSIYVLLKFAKTIPVFLRLVFQVPCWSIPLEFPLLLIKYTALLELSLLSRFPTYLKEICRGGGLSDSHDDDLDVSSDSSMCFVRSTVR